MSGLLRRFPIRTIVDFALYKKICVHYHDLLLIKYFKIFHLYRTLLNAVESTTRQLRFLRFANLTFFHPPTEILLWRRPKPTDWDWDFLRTQLKFSCPRLTPDPITFFDFHTCSSMSHHSRITLFSSHKSLCLFRDFYALHTHKAVA